jgi:hypothetical protein
MNTHKNSVQGKNENIHICTEKKNPF